MERRNSSSAPDLPQAAEEAVDQYGAADEAFCGTQPLEMRFADDPGPIGVGYEQVVVLGQEAHGRRRIRVRTWRIGKIEELVAHLVVEGCQTRSQPLDNVAQPGQPAPLLDVLDRCRTECA